MNEITELIALRQYSIIITIICGLVIVYFGYKLLILGVTGKFSFKASMSGFKADIVSVSPGLLFVIFGAYVIVSSLNHGFEINHLAGHVDGSNIPKKDIEEESNHISKMKIDLTNHISKMKIDLTNAVAHSREVEMTEEEWARLRSNKSIQPTATAAAD